MPARTEHGYCSHAGSIPAIAGGRRRSGGFDPTTGSPAAHCEEPCGGEAGVLPPHRAHAGGSPREGKGCLAKSMRVLFVPPPCIAQQISRTPCVPLLQGPQTADKLRHLSSPSEFIDMYKIIARLDPEVSVQPAGNDIPPMHDDHSHLLRTGSIPSSPG